MEPQCRVYRSLSAAATRGLAARLAPLLPRPAVLALDGGMGAGKTVFVSGLAHGLGLPDRVASPTFALAFEHVDAAGEIILVHMDAWRLPDGDAFNAAGLDLYFDEPCALLAIEWARNIAGALPADTIAIRFAADGETRRIALCLPPPVAAALDARLSEEPVPELHVCT
ncbi:MAG: tRNA (adenosine(37)-N6)-threonylcarbamoyltransferase complex ATPase subunit type 1 TsaE [Bacillota bacterium]|nr:tRNA (adenosine(37)-N6)-threonylcarbamoyltransferase complex ATPase subunit type 1 TsaE [Bacillota bacterium]